MTGVPQEAVSGSPSCFVTVGTVAQILYPISSNQGQFRMEKLILICCFQRVAGV